jgi:uncharacterized membrane protein YkvA (DUF1232 family)
MTWLGALALFIGVILTFAIRGGATDIGIATMVAGAILAIIGIVRLGRDRRRRVGGRLQGQIYRTSTGKMLAMIVAVIYILSPIDIIPDVFLPFGIVDDATAFSWLVFAISQEVSRKRRNAL